MKKVLFVMPNLSGGGAEKVLVDILKKIDKKKFEVTLLLFELQGVYLKEVPKEVKIISIKRKLGRVSGKVFWWYFKKNPKKVYDNIVKTKYDVEIGFMEGHATKLVANSSNKSSKKIAWVHIDMLAKHWTKDMYFKDEEKMCYKIFNDIIFVSKDSGNTFDKLFGENFKNKRVIYNPIIEEDIREKGSEKEIKYDEFTIISSGRLDIQKGFDRLIEVHTKLVKEFKHKLIILGEGSERKRLEQIIQENRVENSVKLLGFVKNPHPYIKAADVFVCSSRTEGFSLVVAEALVLEKAIVSTNITGPREVLNEGEYGMVCENSTDGLYKAIRMILSDKNIIKEYQDRSKLGKGRFNHRNIIKEIEKLF